MLKWAGMEAVAVLDLRATRPGKPLGARCKAGLPPCISRANFTLAPNCLRRYRNCSKAEVLATCGRHTIVDARGHHGFKGWSKPLDPGGQYIPGAPNRPFTGQPGARWRFIPAATAGVRRFAGGVAECGAPLRSGGSGRRTQRPAMELAGLGCAALMPLGWSEWCSDPSRPVAQGRGSAPHLPRPGALVLQVYNIHQTSVRALAQAHPDWEFRGRYLAQGSHRTLKLQR